MGSARALTCACTVAVPWVGRARRRVFQGYGPGVPDGYGACYAFNDHTIKVGISCTTSPAHSVDASRFRTALASALLDLRALAEATHAAAARSSL